MRTDSFLSLLSGRGIDAALITSTENQRYLSSFDFTDGYLLLTARGCYLLTDGRYIEAAEKSLPAHIAPLLMKHDRKAQFDEIFERDGIKVVGFEDCEMTCADFKAFSEAHPSIGFAALGGTLREMRARKDAEEVAAIRRAQAIAEDSLSAALSLAKPDMTETELAAELEYQARRRGAEKMSFDTICVSGDASALPHGVPRNKHLQRGFLIIDFGVVFDGYCSDMTRTYAIGSVTAEMKRVYETVLSAQAAGFDSLAAGVSCKAADAAARAVITEAGYGEFFTHSLGHGVGLEIHEQPNLSPATAEDKLLLAGNIVTVEPGIYLPGTLGCRIEDMAAITDTGAENLTRASKELTLLF